MENVSINQGTEHTVVSVVGAFFYPSAVRMFFQTDLSVQHLQSSFDAKKVSIEPLMKSLINSINIGRKSIQSTKEVQLSYG